MSLSQKLCIDHNEDDDELSSLSSTSSSFSQIHSKDQASITTAAATYSVGNERSKNTATLPSPLLSTSAASSFHSPTGRQRAIKLESSVYPQQTQPNTNVASSRLMSRVSGLSRDTHSDPSLISLAGAGGANENETITRVGSFCGSVSTNGPSMVSPSYTSKLVATHHSLGSSATLKQSRKPQKLGSLEISRQSLSSLGGGSTDSSDHGLRSSFLFNQGSSPHHLQSSVGTIPFRGVASGVTRNSVPEIRRRCLNDISCRLVSVTRNGEGLCLQNDLEATPSLPRQEKTLSQKGVTRHSNDSITLSAHSEGVYGTDSHCFHELNPNTNTTQTKATNTVKGRQRYRRGVNNSSRLYVQDNMDDEEYDDGFRVNLDSREESFNSYDDEHGTEESPTEDDPDSFMNELFLRRGNVTSPVDKTTMIENTTVW